MTWTSTLPDAPGRYWWRAPDKFKRAQNAQYGLILVAWTHYMKPDYAPELRVVSMSIFNSHSGELSLGEGWASSGSHSSKLAEHYPGIEFWSEPERGPEGFLPELPSKPYWTPPDPKVLETKRKKVIAESAKREQEETDERAARIAEAKASGDVLYVCTQCDELYAEDDLIQVRECPHCNDERFNGTDEGQNCPSCNRRFTRNITEKGCPDCLDEECEPLAETVPPPDPKPEPKRCATQKRKR